MSRTINFENNLKYYRVKYQWTQKQLAEKIGYTEKSVSKWENGNALPTMELFLKLSDLFHVSLDELMFEKNVRNYFLGIDGGGTKTVFKLIDENGTVINKICKGASNPNDIGMENATVLLKDGINEVCNGIPFAQITMFAGLSGGGLTSDNVKILNRFLKKFGFHAYDNGSDIENLVALSDYQKCILVIMGTGFIVYTIDGTKQKRIAGWGQFFDEGGSGYTLGRDVISAVLCAGDGSGEKTLLTSLLEEKLGETAEAHLSKFYEKGKAYIAEFAELVFQAAEQNDKVSCNILEKNMSFVAHRINTAVLDMTGAAGNTDASEKVNCTEIIPVLFSGGISAKSDRLFPLIEKNIENARCRLIRLENEPVDGAVKRARQIFGNSSAGTGAIFETKQ